MSGRILVCGARDWKDKLSIQDVIKELVSQYGDEISIIHGAAPGADTMAGDIALALQLVTVAVPAKWEKHGKAAGPIRNKYMLEKCKPHLVLAFHPNLQDSRGTKHMVGIAKSAGVPVLHIKNHKEVDIIHEQFPSRLCPETTHG